MAKQQHTMRHQQREQAMPPVQQGTAPPQQGQYRPVQRPMHHMQMQQPHSQSAPPSQLIQSTPSPMQGHGMNNQAMQGNPQLQTQQPPTQMQTQQPQKMAPNVPLTTQSQQQNMNLGGPNGMVLSSQNIGNVPHSMPPQGGAVNASAAPGRGHIRPDAAQFFQRPANFQASSGMLGNVMPRPNWPAGPRRPGYFQGGVSPGNPPEGSTQQQQIQSQNHAAQVAVGGPQQYVLALIEKINRENEQLLGDESHLDKSKKRPLANEEKLFWDIPLSARLIAGLSLLEADASLTQGHCMGGATDYWSALDPMPSAMSCGNQVGGVLRFGGAESYRMTGAPSLPPKEFLYTECSLMGVIDEKEHPAALPEALRVLHSLCDATVPGLWKDECWRVDSDCELMIYVL